MTAGRPGPRVIVDAGGQRPFRASGSVAGARPSSVLRWTRAPVRLVPPSRWLARLLAAARPRRRGVAAHVPDARLRRARRQRRQRRSRGARRDAAHAWDDGGEPRRTRRPAWRVARRIAWCAVLYLRRGLLRPGRRVARAPSGRNGADSRARVRGPDRAPRARVRLGVGGFRPPVRDRTADAGLTSFPRPAAPQGETFRPARSRLARTARGVPTGRAHAP